MGSQSLEIGLKLLSCGLILLIVSAENDGRPPKELPYSLKDYMRSDHCGQSGVTSWMSRTISRYAGR